MTPPRGRRRQRYWLWSVLLHAMLLALLFLSPARQILLPVKAPPEKAELTLRGDRLEQVIETIRQSEADLLAMRVDLLDAAADRMTTNKETFEKRFSGFESVQRRHARGDLLKGIPEVRELHSRLTGLLAPLNRENLLTERGAVDEAFAHCAKLLDRQERLRRGVLLLSLDSALYTEQQSLDELVMTVDQHLRWSLEGLNRHDRGLQRIVELENNLIPQREAALQKQQDEPHEKAHIQERELQKVQGQLQVAVDQREEAVKSLGDQLDQAFQNLDVARNVANRAARVQLALLERIDQALNPEETP